MTESAAEKAGRYLVEGRLIVEAADASEIVACCRGLGAEYVLGCRDGKWWCTCPAKGTCSHLIALQLVTCVSEGKA